MRRIDLPCLGRLLLALCLAATASCRSPLGNERTGSQSPADDPNEPASSVIDLQLLSVSDWHGQLDPLAVKDVGNVGGAAAISTYFQADRAAQPNTLTLTAGDAFGASPPLASFFDEEPAVRVMNLMGFAADGLGNHNFDKGVEHLGRMMALATYPFLSANLTYPAGFCDRARRAGTPCLPIEPYRIFELGGVHVVVVGVTNPDAMALVKPGSFGDITVGNPAIAALDARATANWELSELDAGLDQPAPALFVLITHMGAIGTDPTTGAPTGPLVDLANQVYGFDIILGDHTNVPVNATINGALVVENKSQGLTYAKVAVKLDSATGVVVAKTAEIVTPLADKVTADPAIVALLEPLRTDLAKQFDAKVATATDVYQRGNNVERLGEVPIGDLLADALRVRYETQLAFTNGGGIRASIPSSYLPKDESLHRPATGPGPYDVVIGDAYTVLPFGNSTVTRTVTGAQLWKMLEHSVEALPSPNGWFGQISGFRFTFDSSQPVGSRVLTVALDDGTAIAADETRYTMATADFLDTGGDGYTMLVPSDGVSRDKMADVLLDYMRGLGTLTPATDGRIRDVKVP